MLHLIIRESIFQLGGSTTHHEACAPVTGLPARRRPARAGAPCPALAAAGPSASALGLVPPGLVPAIASCYAVSAASLPPGLLPERWRLAINSRAASRRLSRHPGRYQSSPLAREPPAPLLPAFPQGSGPIVFQKEVSLLSSSRRLAPSNSGGTLPRERSSARPLSTPARWAKSTRHCRAADE